MSDDLKKKKPQDASKVSTVENWEIAYWCDLFGCNEAELKAAVKAVGNSAAAVKKYFGK